MYYWDVPSDAHTEFSHAKVSILKRIYVCIYSWFLDPYSFYLGQSTFILDFIIVVG